MAPEEIKVPATWAVVKLGKFVESQKGKKPKNEAKEKSASHTIPYVDIQTFEEKIVRTWTDGVGCHPCYESDFLMVWDGSRSGLVGKGVNGALGSTLVRINFPLMVNDYAYYFLKSKYQQINTRAKGSGTPHVDPDLLWNYDFPIPPLKEQYRIVEKIEELFSELDQGIESIKLAQEQLNIYRQAVLNYEFAKCSEFRNLEALLSEKLTNGYSGKPVLHETDIKVLSLSATTSGSFDKSKYKFLDEKNLEKRDIWCVPEDILIQRGNTIEYVGVPAIYTSLPKKFIFPDLMIRVRANNAVISTKYLYYALSSPSIRNSLRKKATGSAGTMPKINQTTLKELLIPYVDINTQKHLVEKIELNMDSSRMLKDSLNESLLRSEALRQSILQKAFTGQLVSQDPSDEPASKLLARIKLEVIKSQPVKKKKAS